MVCTSRHWDGLTDISSQKKSKIGEKSKKEIRKQASEQEWAKKIKETKKKNKEKGWDRIVKRGCFFCKVSWTSETFPICKFISQSDGSTKKTELCIKIA